MRSGHELYCCKLEFNIHETGHIVHKYGVHRRMRISELVDSRLIPEAAARQQRNSSAHSGAASGSGGGSAAGVAYLAQHPLFEQLPRLRADFAVPSYCGLGRLQHVNAWLGTGGARS